MEVLQSCGFIWHMTMRMRNLAEKQNVVNSGCIEVQPLPITMFIVNQIEVFVGLQLIIYSKVHN